MSILPPPGQRKIATSWVAILALVAIYIVAVNEGADVNDALDATSTAIVWIAGLVFGANAGVSIGKGLRK